MQLLGLTLVRWRNPVEKRLMQSTKPANNNTPHTDLSDVHVVVNSYGREAWYVERAISAILRQKHLPAAIHFIDQNDAPLTLGPALREEPLLHHHLFPDRVGASARNFALRLIRTGWIAFADDDACWVNDYSEHLLSLLNAHPSLHLIAGPMIDEQSLRPYTLRHKLGGSLKTFIGSKLLYGANFLVRAEIFARVKGYDTRIGPGTRWPSSEEADLCWRIILLPDVECRYVRALAILHPPMHDANACVAARKAYRYGIGKGSVAAIWLFEKHHRYGSFEYIEMTILPVVNLFRGLLRNDLRQLRIQPAQWWGRQVGFWTFAFRRMRSSAP